MITISLCMIVKNEEENLPACLGCLADLVDEMNEWMAETEAPMQSVISIAPSGATAPNV